MADMQHDAAPMRVTVNLSGRVVGALNYITEYREETKTEVINKALLLYAEITKLIESGGALYTRGAQSGELERIRIV